MSEQIPLSDEASALEPELDAARRDKTNEVAPDIAYRRLGIVNVIFCGPAGAGDREWVLVDAGDIVVHLFKPDARALYALEKMWGSELDEGGAGTTAV